MNGFHSITIPQLNVNDDLVTLLEWSVPHGTRVEADTPISVLETSKAANELCAEQPGVLYHLVAPVQKVKVGDEIGLIGPSIAEIEAYLAERSARSAAAREAVRPAAVQTTPKARRMMDERGITEADIIASGIQGAIKEKDVIAYLHRHRQPETQSVHPNPDPSMIPPVIQALTENQGALSDHEAAIAGALSISCCTALLTTADIDLDLAAVNSWIACACDAGQMVTVLHCIIAAVARALMRFPRLRSFYSGRQVHCYRECAVAFVVQSIDGRLFTPVIRSADTLSVAEIARQCHALTMKVNRHTIRQDDLTGGAFAISYIASPPLRSFRALPNAWQSSALAVAGQRTKLALVDGRCTEVPVSTLTLTYDHALCDGVYAAEFLHALSDELNRLVHD
jgi:pyruvate/2-oxoglutarate dehydrogenase complex dihydrolipoamide acyltransferase (E2) component